MFFFFNDSATTEIYTLSLHDALPILPLHGRASDGGGALRREQRAGAAGDLRLRGGGRAAVDRKSTRLNSSHANISYAVFCLKKKNKNNNNDDYVIRLRRQTNVEPQST